MIEKQSPLKQNTGIKNNFKKILPKFGLALLTVNISAPVLANTINVQTNPSPSNNIVQSEPQLAHLPPELQSIEKWNAFKTLWQKLNAITPSQPQKEIRNGQQLTPIKSEPTRNRWPTLPNYKHRAYYQSLNAEQAENLQTDLKNIFGDNIISPEAKMLFRLTELRIQEMSQAERLTPDFKMLEGASMCRAGPPACMDIQLLSVSPTQYLVDSIDRIETRTTALIILRKKGVIKESTFNTALKAIQEDAKLALYLDTLTEPALSRYNRSATFLFETEDFTGSSKAKPFHKINMKDINTWEKAAQKNKIRHQNDSKLTPNSNPILVMKPEATIQAQAELLIKKLATLRTALDRLDPLLTELER